MKIIMKVRETKDRNRKTVTIPQEATNIKKGDYVEIEKIK